MSGIPELLQKYGLTSYEMREEHKVVITKDYEEFQNLRGLLDTAATVRASCDDKDNLLSHSYQCWGWTFVILASDIPRAR
jgi:hypothetical protein